MDLAAECDRLLEWAKRARVEAGFGWLDDDGVPDPAQGAPLWITARMTHVFALGELLGHPGCAELCDHGLRSLPREGAPEAYDHSFVVLAAASALAAGRPGAPALLDAATAVAEQRFWREEEGACADEEPYRGANANMHMVEAFLAAGDATGDPVWHERALRIATKLIDGFARADAWRVPEHYSEDWQPLHDYHADEPRHRFRPYGVTPGHGLEWSRLLLHLDASLPDPPAWLREAARGLYDRAWADGWDAARGGFAYTTDRDGNPVVADRFHWVVCEAIAAAAALGDATGMRTAWAFAEGYLIDRERGSWRHELDPENRPAARTWQGKPDVYHALGATLLPRLPLAPSAAWSLRLGPPASSRT